LLPNAENTAIGFNWLEDSATTGEAEVELLMDAKLNPANAVRK
jgi:hypothetical protein